MKAAIFPGLVLVAALAGCRGEPSRQPPVHLNPNMDTQDRYDPYGPSGLFEDGRAMRHPPAGTVARGLEKADDAYWRGKDASGQFATTWPEQVPVTAELLQRGRERYDIYCAPCHDRAGEGKGIVAQRGLVPPPSYHSDAIRNMPHGQLYDVIRNGVRTMPGYAAQIPVRDRWAIVAYIRALQRSQYAAAADVPPAERERLR